MKLFQSALLAATCLLTANAQALVISDVVSINKVLDLGSHRFQFDLSKHGYDHLTDSINFVEVSYDFTKTIDEVDDFDAPDTLETIQLNSYIFDGRTNFYDINPEIIKQQASWIKDESFCQRENYDNGECDLNLDLDGRAEEFLSVYNGKVWLDKATFTVNVTRAEIPEPASLILLGMGLIAIFLIRNKSA